GLDLYGRLAPYPHCASGSTPPVTVPAVDAPPSSPHETAQGVHGALGDLIHRAGGVDAEQDALVGVERDQRRGLQLIHLKAVPDRFLAVVVPLEQLAAAIVADS